MYLGTRENVIDRATSVGRRWEKDVTQDRPRWVKVWRYDLLTLELQWLAAAHENGVRWTHVRRIGIITARALLRDGNLKPAYVTNPDLVQFHVSAMRHFLPPHILLIFPSSNGINKNILVRRYLERKQSCVRR